jgi:hypothetical protein
MTLGVLKEEGWTSGGDITLQTHNQHLELEPPQVLARFISAFKPRVYFSKPAVSPNLRYPTLQLYIGTETCDTLLP